MKAAYCIPVSIRMFRALPLLGQMHSAFLVVESGGRGEAEDCTNCLAREQSINRFWAPRTSLTKRNRSVNGSSAVHCLWLSISQSVLQLFHSVGSSCKYSSVIKILVGKHALFCHVNDNKQSWWRASISSLFILCLKPLLANHSCNIS